MPGLVFIDTHTSGPSLIEENEVNTSVCVCVKQPGCELP